MDYRHWTPSSDFTEHISLLSHLTGPGWLFYYKTSKMILGIMSEWNIMLHWNFSSFSSPSPSFPPSLIFILGDEPRKAVFNWAPTPASYCCYYFYYWDKFLLSFSSWPWTLQAFCILSSWNYGVCATTFIPKMYSSYPLFFSIKY